MTTGISKVREFCEGNASVGLVLRELRLEYNKYYDGFEALAYYLSKPLLPYAQSWNMVLTSEKNDPIDDSALAVAEELQHFADLLEGHAIELHLVMKANSGLTTQQIFDQELCKLFREKMSGFVTTLSFHDNGQFSQDGHLHEDNEKRKLSELHEFFVTLPAQFQHVREVFGKFPIFARINGKLTQHDNIGYQLYHLTKMAIDGEDITFIDERLHTAGPKDTRLRGEKTGFQKRVNCLRNEVSLAS
jgi:hypothetical protein